jgi:hypothetical protein
MISADMLTIAIVVAFVVALVCLSVAFAMRRWG